jgi:hypothetical protein
MRSARDATRSGSVLGVSLGHQKAGHQKFQMKGGRGGSRHRGERLTHYIGHPGETRCFDHAGNTRHHREAVGACARQEACCLLPCLVNNNEVSHILQEVFPETSGVLAGVDDFVQCQKCFPAVSARKRTHHLGQQFTVGVAKEANGVFIAQHRLR